MPAHNPLVNCFFDVFSQLYVKIIYALASTGYDIIIIIVIHLDYCPEKKNEKSIIVLLPIGFGHIIVTE